MIGQNDQRSFYRMMVNAECVIALDNVESQQKLQAVCRDLSATGMAVELDTAVDVGQEVNVAITSTNAQIPSLNAKGKVLRCAAEGDMWVVGIEILEMN
jgi:c-di-GMP-binding flagellar brake protein YcgR